MLKLAKVLALKVCLALEAIAFNQRAQGDFIRRVGRHVACDRCVGALVEESR